VRKGPLLGLAWRAEAAAGDAPGKGSAARMGVCRDLGRGVTWQEPRRPAGATCTARLGWAARPACASPTCTGERPCTSPAARRPACARRHCLRPPFCASLEDRRGRHRPTPVASRDCASCLRAAGSRTCSLTRRTRTSPPSGHAGPSATPSAAPPSTCSPRTPPHTKPPATRTGTPAT
jgi:hypothetical protein